MLARRLAPCKPVLAHSPAAYKINISSKGDNALPFYKINISSKRDKAAFLLNKYFQ